jgi:metallopeptidase MepB
MALGAYRKPHQEPLSFNDTSETLVHKAKEFCAQHNQAITNLMAQIDPETAKFDNFLLLVAHLNNDWISYRDFIEFYAEVSPNEEIRDASREAAHIFSAGEIKKPDISQWIKTISGKDEELNLESRKFLNVMKEDYPKSEEPTSKDRLKAINKRIADICVNFDANLHNENGGFWASNEPVAKSLCF